MARRDPRLRAFVKVDKNGDVVPSSLILRRKPPENGVSHWWQEIEANACCSQPLSNWDFFDGSTIADGILQITVNGAIVVNATNTGGGTYAVGAGQVVAITLTGSGPTKTLLVVDDTSGSILSNQTGTTGILTYTYTAPGGHVYTVEATQNETTTTTTTTTSTSTTSTSTTSTTSTTTSSTTTTITTVANGSAQVNNLRAAPAGITITNVADTQSTLTGGTFPVAANAGTTMTISGTATNTDINVTIAGTGNLGGAVLSLYKGGALVESLGPITAAGVYTFGPVSYTTANNLEIVLV